MDNFDSIYSTNNRYNTTLFNEETRIHNEDTTTTTQHTIPSEFVDTTYTAVVAAGNTYISETTEKGDIPPLGATSDDHYYCNSYNNQSTPGEQTFPNTSLTTAAVVATGSNPSSSYNNNNEDQNGVVMKKCVGRSNRGVTFGEASEQGLRKTMEDTCGIYPEFMTLSCIEVGGCTAPSCRYASVKSPVHYFGVFDGHGGSQASSHCANELHIKLAEEWGKEVGIDDWRRRWEVALGRAFERVDDGLIDRTLASVGSTASVVILSACQIIAANCGDSRVVLCRGKQAIPLTVDHKLNRQDEVARITDGGGMIVEWGYCLRVEGVLSMTRAIGDHSLKPYIIPVPEITFTTRNAEDEFLVLASDGLWDVLSNDDVIKLARKELREHRRRPKSDDNSSCPASFVAEGLVKYALDAYSQDNISVIVVDLKLPRIRVQQKQ
ncbi:hypothetical protein Dsin_013939 [Dipteronia sinensis]|uniref:protein-serine/threonine phosphatase n=1 Tax=Dipteronia sinensis TaxID=43782 RepID=A0AAE0E9K6_9ROSI|nr:hypothetical protein Dsin_013939 [Dipteronia sinensis]